MTDNLLKYGPLGLPEYSERRLLHTELNADVYELVNIPLQLSHLVLLDLWN